MATQQQFGGSSSSSGTTLEPGTLVAGRYRVVHKLGEGGMGAVYRAVQEPLGREVALKVITPALAVDRDAVERFRREAKAASALAHPNIVTVFDFGTDGPTLFLAMELLSGEGLDALVARGPTTVPRVLHILRGVCAALAEAHNKGIVHRDLKPQNIMLVSTTTQQDIAKVVDFGIARMKDGGRTLTATGGVIGTPGYVAPELFDGNEASPRSDLYALGVVAYELLCGTAPFPGKTPMEVLKASLFGEPQPMRAFVRDVPDGVEALVMSLLARAPGQRPASATDLDARLAALQQPATSSTASPATGTSSTASPATASSPTASPATGASSTAALPPDGASSTTSTGGAPSTDPGASTASGGPGVSVVDEGGGGGRVVRVVAAVGVALGVTAAGVWALRDPRSAESPDPAPAVDVQKVGVAVSLNSDGTVTLPGSIASRVGLAAVDAGVVEPVDAVDADGAASPRGTSRLAALLERPDAGVATTPDGGQKTEIVDPEVLPRILGGHPFGDHWVDEGVLGRVEVTNDNGLLRVRGRQDGANGKWATIEGVITKVEKKRFTFEGSLVTTGDESRPCRFPPRQVFGTSWDRWRMRDGQSPCSGGAWHYFDIFWVKLPETTPADHGVLAVTDGAANDVIVDGTSYGPGPVAFNLAAGRHQMTLVVDGKKKSRALGMRAGRVVRINAAGE